MRNDVLHDFINVLPLRCDVFTDALILPMLSVDTAPVTSFALGAYAEGKALSQAHRYVWGKRFSKQLPLIPTQTICTQEVIYGGVFWGHWGHFLVETLQRLWYAKENDLPIVWMTEREDASAQNMFTAQQKEIFAGLGIDNSHIFLTKPTRFAKVHFPEPGFGLLHYAHPEHFAFLGYYTGEVCKGKYVYFSRSRYNNCVNEKEMEDMLRTLGWEIVYPEQCSASEQLSFLTTSEVCMMISGSAQHSLMLTKNSKTRFIVIPRVQSITYNLIANFASNNYFLFDLKKQVVNSGMDNSKEKFKLNLSMLQDVIQKTNNFTSDLSVFFPILKPAPNVLQNYACLPEVYHSADVSVSKVEEYFYKAVFFFRDKKYQESYKILMHLYKENLLEFFMYDYFFQVVDMYDALYANKTELHISKNSFLLKKATKMLENDLENGENYIRLAEVLQTMGRCNDAIETMHKAIKKFPQWALLRAALAKIYLECGNTNKALEYSQSAFQLDPYDVKVKQVVAYCIHSCTAQHNT